MTRYASLQPRIVSKPCIMIHMTTVTEYWQIKLARKTLKSVNLENLQLLPGTYPRPAPAATAVAPLRTYRSYQTPFFPWISSQIQVTPDRAPRSAPNGNPTAFILTRTAFMSALKRFTSRIAARPNYQSANYLRKHYRRKSCFNTHSTSARRMPAGGPPLTLAGAHAAS